MKHTLFLLTFLTSGLAHADWGPELTNMRNAPRSNDQAASVYRLGTVDQTFAPDSDANGAEDCAAGFTNGIATPARPAGGWFEWRFVSHASPGVDPKQSFFLFGVNGATGSIVADVTRLCPRTFNEYTTNHMHGVMNARLAVANNSVFAVYDTSSGYFWQNKIKLQRNPSESGANPNRSYAANELSRNPRLYVDTNPAASTLADPCAATGIRDASFETRSGRDQEDTACAPPAMIQTFDPDIDVRGSEAYVTWTERYVEGTQNGVVGFDPTYPIIGGSPYRRLAVHLEKVQLAGLLTRQSQDNTGRSAWSPSDEAGLNMNRTAFAAYQRATRDAISPRVTAVETSGVVQPVVAWVELATDLSEQAGEFGVQSQLLANSESATGTLYVRRVTSATYATPTSVAPSICNIESVSSGRATGRKRTYTGTHDIATWNNGSSEVALIIASARDASGAGDCKLRAYTFNGTTVAALPGNNVSESTTTSWPRVTVVDNIPYVTWVDNDSSVQVARYTGGAWSNLSDTPWGQSTRVSGPAISVLKDNNPYSLPQEIAPVTVTVTFNQETVDWSGVLPAGANKVWGVKQATCPAARNSLGLFKCSIISSAVTTRTVPTGTVYSPESANLLGISWGSRKSGIKPGYPSRQLVGYEEDVGGLALPGATDLVTDPTTLQRYVAYPGPVGDHRDQDRGVYVKRERAYIPNFSHLFPLYIHTLRWRRPGPEPEPDPAVWMRRAYAWGQNTVGNLGNNTYTNSLSPVGLNFTEPIVKMTGGNSSSFALTSTGKVYGWGNNGDQVIVQGQQTSIATPTLMAIPQNGTAHNFVDIAAGYQHLAAVRNDGTVWTRGNNQYGQLGNNTFTSQSTWVQVQGITDVVSVYAGSLHTCALTHKREAYCWGSNDSQQVGNNSKNHAPTAVFVMGNVRSLATGGYHTAATTVSGGVYVWGANSTGQLGLGDTTNRGVPTLLQNMTSPKVSLGAQNTYVLELATGVLTAAGSDYYGGLGDGTPLTDRSYLGVVSAAGWVEDVIAGASAYHAFITTTHGDVRQTTHTSCFGANSAGQCGNGGTSNLAKPTPVFDPVTFGCAAGTQTFQFFRSGNTDLYGCAAAQTFANKGAVCASGATVGSAADWKAYSDDTTYPKITPTYHYWTSDLLKYSGSGSNACSVSVTTGTDCGSTTPMRLCASSTYDPLQNKCNWLGCGLDATSPAYNFGGCAGNTTAGTLCKVANPPMY